MIGYARLTTLVATLVIAPAALAGPYGDDMAKCLVASTTPEDKTMLVQWMFGAASLHPAVKAMSTVNDAQRAALNKRFAEMLNDLLTRTCVKEARDAIKYEGTGTIESSFNVLGQVAGRELFAHPNVAGGLKGLENHLDKAQLQKALGIKQ